MRLTPPTHNALSISIIMVICAVCVFPFFPELSAIYGIFATVNLAMACLIKGY